MYVKVFKNVSVSAGCTDNCLRMHLPKQLYKMIICQVLCIKLLSPQVAKSINVDWILIPRDCDPQITPSTSAPRSSCDTAAKSDRGHSWQYSWFHELQKHPRRGSPICFAENMCLVYFWQKLLQAAQNKLSQAGSQTQEQRIRSFPNKTTCADSGFTSQNRQQKTLFNYVVYSLMIDAQE